MADNGKALFVVFEFKKQKYMTKAQSLFEQYRKECGMDDDDLKAARWYKDGLIEFADWLLQQKCEQCNVSGSLPPDELDSAAERYLIPKYFTSMPTIEEEIKEFNELKEAFKDGYLLRQ